MAAEIAACQGRRSAPPETFPVEDLADEPAGLAGSEAFRELYRRLDPTSEQRT
jgi:hypothetical protein